VLAYIYILFNI